MSATLADPYRGFMVNYTHHGSGKDANHEDIISYGAAQLLIQDRPTDIRYHSDTTQPPFASPSTFITDRLLPRQMAPHYDTHNYGLAPLQDRRKRQRTNSDLEVNRDTNQSYGHRPILHGLSIDSSAPSGESTDLIYPVHVDPSSSHQTPNPDYIRQGALLQQHHHHRMPSQALVAMSSGNDGHEATEPPQSQMDLSFMSLPGVPRPWPAPKIAKTRFGHKEDDMLIELKERWNFSWKQIECFFPGRKQQTLQVRYCTKLKERTVVWDNDKDRKLKKALEDYENDKWAHVARKLGPGVPAAACKLRAAELESELELE
ncbi:hypothetical protein N7457_009180 [Penicillium paradoxum]|uniref:uncharacterized protein n=1 Tax=Penicillium paradoxum TaxID=176176 RepID=UPI002547AA06|nr:uncharacterized protein N7457_009180 [Penicillium paradoxum]KAJ5774284.1 hypothetical protein N7457_009180 [Penicillium paradoxum]